ncbi:hypothetical protein GA0074704_2630 [Micromonospora siamensis]|uniref:O-antigen ligase n=2 Tax=Micromonospora siamensis TaxID=299152 RepID=A0A1C5HZD8_9ACTN|nr:hypothetical protein GA0074704_2630 [Micromonospora siamensis]
MMFCAAAAGAAAGTSLLLGAVVCTLLVLLLIFLLDSSETWVCGVSLVLCLACAVSLEQLAPFQDVVRIAAVLLLVAGVASGMLRTAKWYGRRLRPARPLMELYLIGMTGYLLAATLPFGEARALAVGILGLLTTAAYLLLAARYVSPRALDAALVAVLMLTVAASLVLGLVAPDVAVVGERLRGVTANANLLGVYGLLLVATVVLRKRSWPLTSAGAVLGGAAIVWTASRGSALSLLLALVVGAVVNAGRARRLALPVVALAAAPFFWSLRNASAADLTLYRTNNSREVGIREVMELMRADSLAGLGIHNAYAANGSAVLTAFVQGGLLAICLILMICVAFLWSSWKSGPATFALALGVVLHSNFEPWALASMSPISLLVALTWLSLVETGARTLPKRAAPTASSLVRHPLGSTA